MQQQPLGIAVTGAAGRFGPGAKCFETLRRTFITGVAGRGIPPIRLERIGLGGETGFRFEVVRVVERCKIESGRRITAAGREEIQKLCVGRPPLREKFLCAGVGNAEVRPVRVGLELRDQFARGVTSLFSRLCWLDRFERSPRLRNRFRFLPQEEQARNHDDDDCGDGDYHPNICFATLASPMVDAHVLLHFTSRRILWACRRGARVRSTEILGKTGKTWLIGLVAGAAAYAIAGFLIAPHAIKLWIESANVSGPGCRLSVREVYVNPFTMFLSFENATLLEQESKLLVSASVAETTIWSFDTLRAGTPGHDVAIHDLVVTSAQIDEPLLAVPSAIIRNVKIGADGRFIEAAHARLDQPDVAITRDAAGIRHRPAWLSMPGNDRAGKCISLDGFRVVGGTLRIQDDAVDPGVRLELRDVVAGARREPGDGSEITDIDVEARIGARGTISIRAQLGSSTGRHPDLFSMSVRNVDLRQVSPYVRRTFGRGVVAGFADASVQHERSDANLRLDDHLTVTGLRLGEPDANTADDTLPLELALALVTDTADRSEFRLRRSIGDSPAQTVSSVFAAGLAAHLESLAAIPFGSLAELAGNPDAVLDEIAFLPGSAEMAPASMDTMTLLAKALGQRPRLGIRVQPAYDPDADRDAIAAQQVRLHIALATSAGARQGRDAAGPDFNDPRVRDILDEFAGARLSEAQRSAIARHVSDVTTTYRDIFGALVANERVSETVLRRLARFRARSVIDALEREGIDRNRFRIAEALDIATTGDETVSLKLEVEALPEAG